MKILVTAKVPYDIKKHLAGHDVDYNETTTALTAAELAERAKDADAIIRIQRQNNV